MINHRWMSLIDGYFVSECTLLTWLQCTSSSLYISSVQKWLCPSAVSRRMFYFILKWTVFTRFTSLLLDVWEPHFPLHNHYLPQILTSRISQPKVSSFIHISGRAITCYLCHIKMWKRHIYIFEMQHFFFFDSINWQQSSCYIDYWHIQSLDGLNGIYIVSLDRFHI